MNDTRLSSRITARMRALGGKPVIRDTRLSVELVLSLMAQGADQDELLDDYPGLEAEDMRACIAYAQAFTAGDSLSAVRIDVCD